MFEYRFTWWGDYGPEYGESYNPVSLEEAIEAVDGYEDATIETESGTTVYEDGVWLMSQEEAKALAAKEQSEEEAREAAKEAEKAAELATFGDYIDEANIAFIKSICAKYPARDYGAQSAAREISSNSGWVSMPSYKGTEADVVHTVSNRFYHIDMWRGSRKVTREAIK